MSNNIDGIIIPQGGDGYGPSYVTQINSSLNAINSHNHDTASGKPAKRVHVDATDDSSVEATGGVMRLKDGGITEAALTGGGTIPAGSIISFFDKDDSSPGSGWLRCDGAQVSRATHANLYSVIGNRFGSGDGTTTFHLPNLAGQFVRGADLGAGRDSDAGSRAVSASGGATGDNVGTLQKGATKVHTHSIVSEHTWRISGGSSGANYGGDRDHRFLTPGYNINNSGGNEFRPKNMYVAWWIKT